LGKHSKTNNLEYSLECDFQSWYEYSDVVEAWKTLLKACDTLSGSAGYLHDLVDLTRQVLQNNGDIYYNKLVAAFNAGNITEFEYVIH